LLGNMNIGSSTVVTPSASRSYAVGSTYRWTSWT
jgi:hypothetical protein